MPATPADPRRRLSDQLDEARRQGAEAERINGRIVKLEDHAKSVNGQLVRLADGQDNINAHLQTITESLRVAEGVSTRLEKIAESSGAKKLGRWQLIGLLVGVPVGAITIVAYFLQILQGLH